MRRFMEYVSRTIFLLLRTLLLLIPLSVSGFGQPNALQFITNIPIPNWTTTGPNAASFDALWFNPQNGVVYIADRINDGATAVDTKTMTALGTSVAPGCGIQTATAPASTNCRPSGILVTPDTQKLVFTARGPQASNPNAPPSGLWVFDLKAPTEPPILIQTLPGPDFLDYNPVNQLVYVKTNAPAGVTGNPIVVADPVSGKVVGQINMGAGIEQMHFNPVDGFIYVAITDAGQQAMAKVDP